jgi:hypothetical protein
MAAQRSSRAANVVPAHARLLSVVCTLAAAAMAATCGGQVKVDDDSVDGAGGHGGSAQQSVSNNSSGPGPGPGPGPSSVNASAVSTSNGQGGSGAGGPCFTCAGYIVDCVIDGPAPECDFQPLCPGSDRLFAQLLGCVCMVCAMECFNSCNGQADDGPQCETCQQGAVSGTCSGPFADCSNDA